MRWRGGDHDIGSRQHLADIGNRLDQAPCGPMRGRERFRLCPVARPQDHLLLAHHLGQPLDGQIRLQSGAGDANRLDPSRRQCLRGNYSCRRRAPRRHPALVLEQHLGRARLGAEHQDHAVVRRQVALRVLEKSVGDLDGEGLGARRMAVFDMAIAVRLLKNKLPRHRRLDLALGLQDQRLLHRLDDFRPVEVRANAIDADDLEIAHGTFLCIQLRKAVRPSGT